jgi:hypothetical protein
VLGSRGATEQRPAAPPRFVLELLRLAPSSSLSLSRCRAAASLDSATMGSPCPTAVPAEEAGRGLAIRFDLIWIRSEGVGGGGAAQSSCAAARAEDGRPEGRGGAGKQGARWSRGRRRLLDSSSSSSGWCCPPLFLRHGVVRRPRSLPLPSLAASHPLLPVVKPAGSGGGAGWRRLVGMVRQCGTHSATSGCGVPWADASYGGSGSRTGRAG